MPLTFRDAPAFWRETLAVTVGAMVVGIAAPFVAGVPLDVAAGSAALLGGSIGAVVTRRRPLGGLLRFMIGAGGGTLAALGSAALATRFGLAHGALLGAGLGAVTLASLLSSADDAHEDGVAQATGLVASAGAGMVGIAALHHIAAFTTSAGMPVTFASATMAGALGLWIAAASGLRRVQQERDAILVRGDDVLVGMAEPVRTKVHDALAAWGEIEAALARDDVTYDLVAEARGHARRLMEALLETAHTWKLIERDVGSPRLQALDDKLASLAQRSGETTDAVTLGHLARAAQAVRAQKSAVDGLKVGLQRAEAALDAHMALLDRMRLAVAQHRAIDRERLSIELNAVADQVTLLSDDLESLSAAIAEAESLSDKRLLADVGRAGHRALDALNGTVEPTVDPTVEPRAGPLVEPSVDAGESASLVEVGAPHDATSRR